MVVFLSESLVEAWLLSLQIGFVEVKFFLFRKHFEYGIT